MAFASTDSKVWFDVQKNEPIFVDPYKSNHTQDVINNPEKYRLTSGFFDDMTTHKYDYDGNVLFAAMNRGFVRIALDYKDPRYGCNAEGASLRDIHKAVLWLDGEVGGLRKIIIVVRKSGDDKTADSYILDDEEKIEFFLKWGKILRDRF